MKKLIVVMLLLFVGALLFAKGAEVSHRRLATHFEFTVLKDRGDYWLQQYLMQGFHPHEDYNAVMHQHKMVNTKSGKNFFSGVIFHHDGSKTILRTGETQEWKEEGWMEQD